MNKQIFTAIIAMILGGLFLLKKEQPTGEEASSMARLASESVQDLPKINGEDLESDDSDTDIHIYEEFKDAYRLNLYEQLEANNFYEAYQSVFENRQKFQDPLDFEVFLVAVLKQWGEHSPEQVLAIITNEVPLPSEEIPAILKRIARGLAKQDGYAAFQWLEESEENGLISNEIVGDQIYTVILQEHAKQYPEEVAEIFHEIGNEETKALVIHPLLKELTKIDFTAATTLVLGIEEGELRDKAMEDLIKYNNKDPEFLVDTFLNNQDYVSRGEIADSLDELAEADFHLSQDILLSTEGAGNDEYILTRFASSQAAVDGDRMKSLVEAIEEPDMHDKVVSNLAESYIDSNPGIGISVANGIRDQGQRIEVISNIIQRTSDENIQQFQDYFDEFEDMPYTEKEIYQDQIQKRLDKVELGALIHSDTSPQKNFDAI